MRLFLLSFLLTSAAVVVAGDNASLSGKWQIQYSIADREGKLGCTFTQKDSELTGTCTSDRGDLATTGKVEGKNVTWTYKTDSEGGPVTVVYKGIVEADGKIAGTIAAVEFGVEGEFKATSSK